MNYTTQQKQALDKLKSRYGHEIKHIYNYFNGVVMVETDHITLGIELDGHVHS
jgi:hypothetical protein